MPPGRLALRRRTGADHRHVGVTVVITSTIAVLIIGATDKHRHPTSSAADDDDDYLVIGLRNITYT